MKIPLLRTITLVITICCGAMPGRGDVATDTETAAHRSVLDLAGAFTNDGFKMRDGAYTSTLKAGESAVVEVNLYSGNQYWFAVSTADAKSAVSIGVYNEAGNMVKSEPFASRAADGAKDGAMDTDAASTNRAAAGFAPEASGPYYIKITNTTGVPATCCLIYSYK